MSSTPRIEPWGTLASISVHGEFWSFKTIICFLLFKKSVTILKRLPDIPFCFSLRGSPSYQTSSNAFETSRTTSLSSHLSSNDLYMSWMIDISWLIHEFLYLNPNWFDESKLFSLRNSRILLYINRSKIFQQIGRKKIGR